MPADLCRHSKIKEGEMNPEESHGAGGWLCCRYRGDTPLRSPLCNLTLKFICHQMKGVKEKNSVITVANQLYAAHPGLSRLL